MSGVYAHKGGSVITVSVEGMNEVERDLRQLPDSIAERVLKSANLKASQKMRDFIRANAPIGRQRHKMKSGEYRMPGLLKNSIVTKNVSSSSKFTVHHLVGIDWYKVRYGHLVHFRHNIVTHRPWRRIRGIYIPEERHKFFLPTVAKEEHGLADWLKSRIKEGIARRLKLLRRATVITYGI